MCGLAGFISLSMPLQNEHLNELASVLSHLRKRGPDAQNISQCGTHAALGGTRLRITDSRNTAADLPFTSHCGRYTALLNGEIYNHQNLRLELPTQDYKTNSDTETLVEAFRSWGIACLNKFEGMFAIAIYDHLDRKLYLARDPAGQKPLYFYQDKDAFIFASDINALLANPYRSKTISDSGLSEFISQRMILGCDTHIKEIKKLEGGTYLVSDANGKSSTASYYRLPIKEDKVQNIQDVIQSIRVAIDQSVEETVSNEHRSAVLLSGGIDSTGLLALLQKYGVSPKTYAIGFDKFTGDNFNIPSIFDEFEYSRLAASHFKTDHTEIKITSTQYMEAINEWALMMGEPLEASEAPLLSILFDRIGKDDHRLAYGGSGPDEIFDGYGLGFELNSIEASKIPETYFDKFSWLFDVDANRLIPDNFANMRKDVIRKTASLVAPYSDKTSSSAQLVQIINFHDRLQNYEFNQIDLTSMHNSIEVRSPLISKSITEAAFSFNPDLKRKNNIEKWIYKQAWTGIIPEAFITRKKIGFPTPIEFWFSDTYENAVNEVVFDKSSYLLNSGIIDISYLKQCWANRNAGYRNIFYRLYCATLMLNKQMSDLSISKQKQETIFKAAA